MCIVHCFFSVFNQKKLVFIYLCSNYWALVIYSNYLFSYSMTVAIHPSISSKLLFYSGLRGTRVYWCKTGNNIRIRHQPTTRYSHTPTGNLVTYFSLSLFLDYGGAARGNPIMTRCKHASSTHKDPCQRIEPSSQKCEATSLTTVPPYHPNSGYVLIYHVIFLFHLHFFSTYDSLECNSIVRQGASV